MNQIIDLSHPITNKPTCTFSTADTTPQVYFEEGESHGMFFITSGIDNLHSNVATHIDFPGHMPDRDHKKRKSVGEYQVERFVGKVFIVDVSKKLHAIRDFFDKSGNLNLEINDDDGVLKFLECLQSLEITYDDLQQILEGNKITLDSVKGLLFYSGLSNFWKHEKFESWKYAYFFNPFLSKDATTEIIRNKLSFVGIDAFQLENPIINFNGHEQLLIINKKSRNYVQNKLSTIDIFSNHSMLLGNDIFIYENLNIPKHLSNRIVEFSGAPLNFQIDGMNDNGLVRPYAIIP